MSLPRGVDTKRRVILQNAVGAAAESCSLIVTGVSIVLSSPFISIRAGQHQKKKPQFKIRETFHHLKMFAFHLEPQYYAVVQALNNFVFLVTSK